MSEKKIVTNNSSLNPEISDKDIYEAMKDIPGYLNITNIFTEKKINRVPVVDLNNHLIGIVSRADIVEAPLFRGL